MSFEIFAKIIVYIIIIFSVVYLLYMGYKTAFLSMTTLVAIIFLLLVLFVAYISTTTVDEKDDETGPITVDEAKTAIDNYILKSFNKTVNYIEREKYHIDTQSIHMSGKNYNYYGAIFETMPDKNSQLGEKLRIIWSLDNNQLVKLDGLKLDDANIEPFFNFKPMKIAGNYMKDQGEKNIGTNIIFGSPDKSFSSPNFKTTEKDGNTKDE